jgi:hypothetical protein
MVEEVSKTSWQTGSRGRGGKAREKIVIYLFQLVPTS